MVPVVDFNQNPLMPTTCARAERWVASRKATYFWKHGVYCVRLNVEPSGRETQPIVVGVDPGTKKEGFTVKSASKTYLNIQSDARTGIKEKLDKRRVCRRNRRMRNTPYRASRQNRARLRNTGMPPSIKARWQWKLRVLNWARKIFPITDVIVEDVTAPSKKGKRAWNRSFALIEIGKTWFYQQIEDLARLHTIKGFATSQLRKVHELPKLKAKLSNDFYAHCVDSWVMANSIVGGHTKPDNIRVLYVKPFDFRKRSLHLISPAVGGLRRRHGGTMSEGLKRGTLVVHPKYGLTSVGGTSEGKVSLNCLETGKRLTKEANPAKLNILAYASFKATYFVA